jgi:predicted GNAT family acetyltransferase
MILLNTAWAIAIELGPVTNIHAVSEHTFERPSQATVIEIEWSLPDGYTYDAIEGYYYLFDQSESYEFDEFNTSELHTSQKAISKDFKDDNLNDEIVYFHIAAVALNDEDDLIIGPTENIGPFRIDSVPPMNVGVETSSVTYDRNIELSLIAESTNLEVFISNIGYVQSDTGWIPFESKINWTVSEGDGTKSIYVQFRDPAGNISKASTSTDLIDATTVTLQSPLNSPTNESTITVFANFSQAVTAFDQNDITVTNAKNYSLAGSAGSYTIVIIPDMDGTVSVTIPENAAGGLLSAQTFEIVVDRISPTVTINSNVPAFANSAPWTITISTSESVSDFDESDITVENANIDSFNLIATDYIATISPSNQGPVTITILSNSCTDAAGNNNEQTIQYIRTYDSKAPVLKLETETTISLGNVFDSLYNVTAMDFIDGDLTDQISVSGSVETSAIGDYELIYSINDRAGNSASMTRTVHVVENPINVTIQSPLSSPTNAQEIPVIITFERAVDSFDYTQISIENASIHEVSVNAKIYTIVLTPNADGIVHVHIPEDKAFDSFGNGNVQSGTFEINVDTQKPTVSIASDIPEYANTPCSITITIDEDVVNFDKEDIHVTNGTVQIFSRTDAYTAYISPTTQGNLTITIPSGKFTDIAGNENNQSNSISYTFDSISPEITLKASVSSPTHEQLIQVEALLTEPVIEFNEGKLHITNATIAQGSFEGSYTAYSFDLIPQNEGEISVIVDSDAIEDRAGNKNQNTEYLTIVYEPLEYTLTVDNTNPGAYLPGHEFTIPVFIQYSTGMTSIGYEVKLPDTWNFVSVGGTNIPPNVQQRANLELSWIDNQIESNTLSFYYTVSVPYTENSNPVQISAMVKYRYADGPENIENASFNANLQEIKVTHTVDDTLFIIEEPKKIQIQINELSESMGFNKFTAIGISINFPADWTFERAEGNNIPYTKVIETGNIEFAWYELKDFTKTNPIDMKYYIVPSADAASQETISASLKYRFANGSEQTKPLDHINLTLKDTTSPDVTIDSSIPEYSNSAPWQITITFSEPVTGFKYNDIFVENGVSTDTLLPITEQVYVASISPTTSGLITISIPSNIAADFAGNGNNPFLSYTRVYDIEPPQIVLLGDSPANISVNDEYTDPGADVSDNACVTAQIVVTGTVDTSKEGVYYLVYSVVDCAGNTASVTRTVNVVSFYPTLTVNTIGGAYLPDNQFVLSATMNFTKGTSNIEYIVDLPENWQFDSVWGTKMPDSTTNRVIFGWNNDIEKLEEISFVYTVIVPKNVSEIDALNVNVNYTYEGKLYTKTESVQIEKQNIIAEHTPKSSDYYTNGTVGIDVNIKLEKESNPYNTLSAVGMFVQLPDDWSYYKASNLDPTLDGIYPGKDDTGLLQFAWFDIKNNEISFTYDIKTPTDTESETITATVQYRFANGDKRTIELNDLTFKHSNKPAIASISPENGETTNSGVITLTFTKAVLNFDASDLGIFNGTLKENSFQEVVNDTTFTFTINVAINVTEQSAFGFTIAEGALNDYSDPSNTNPFLSYSFIYDIVKPEVEITSESLTTTHSQSIPITVIFNEPVIGFTESDIQLDNATLDSFKGNDLTYTFNIIPKSPGEMTVFIKSDAVQDIAGNKNLESEKFKLTYQPLEVIVTCDTDAGSYMPGTDYFISVAIHFTQGMSSIGYTVTYPENWKYDSVWGENVPPNIKDQNNILQFFWINLSKDLDTLSFTYALRVPDNERTDPVNIPVAIKYRYADDIEHEIDATINAHLQKLEAKQSTPNNIFIPNYAIPVNVKMQLTEITSEINELSSIGLIVYVPEQLVFDHVEANPQAITPDVAPDKDDTSILQFAWFNINDLSNEPINFTYYVKPLENADSIAISASVLYRFANGMEQCVHLVPLSLTAEKLNASHSCPEKYLDQLKVTTIIEYNGKQSTLKNMVFALTKPNDCIISDVVAPASLLENGEIYLDTAHKASPLDIQYTLKPNQDNQNIEISALLTYTRSGIATTDIELTQTVNPAKISSSKTNQIVTQEVVGLESIANAYYYTPNETIKLSNTVRSAISITSATFTIDLPQGVTFESASITPVTQNNQLIFTVSSSNPVTQLTFWYALKFSGSGQKNIATEVKIGGQSLDITSPLVFYDNLEPKPVVNHQIAEISNVSPMELTLTFSKPINYEGLLENAFALTNATIEIVTIQDKFIYKLNITPKDGNVEIIMPENVIRDNIGNSNSRFEILSVVYDSQSPAIEQIELPEATNLEYVPVKITFSEPVVSFETQDLVIENGTAYSMINQNNTYYTLYIKPTGEGAVKIEIKPGVLQDNAGNTITDSRIETFFYDKTQPVITDLTYSPETINTVMPVSLTITLSEPCPMYEFDVTSGEVISSESVGKYIKAIIKPSSCGELTIQINYIQDAAGNKHNKPLPKDISGIILIDCTTYSGLVYEKPISNSKLLSNVTVNVSFPDDVANNTKTDENGRYTLHLPRMDEMYYAFRLEKQGYITHTFTSESVSDQMTKQELPSQEMETIDSKSYEYTIVCSVTVDEPTPLSLSVIKVISANSDPSNATPVAEFKTYSLCYLYFKNKPKATIVSASMGDYDAQKSLDERDLVGKTFYLNLHMKGPELPPEGQQYIKNSKVISKDDGGKLKLRSSKGESIAEILMLPGTMKMNALVEAATQDKGNSPFAARSQLVDINTEAEIDGWIIIDMQLSGAEDEISKTYNNIMDGKTAVYYAKNTQEYIAGNVQAVPLEHIICFNQVHGYIRFKTNHLTPFGIGDTGLKDPDAGQRRCFISTLQSVSFNPAILIFVLTIFIGLFRNRMTRQ